MTQLKVLGSRELKRIYAILKEAYGLEEELDYQFLQSTRDKIYVFSSDISDIDHTKIRIDTLGLYFATYDEKGLRLTMEGSQIVGPLAKKGIVDLDTIGMQAWLKGEDVPTESSENGFVLVRHGDDFMGSGRIKDGRLINFVPKTRRVGASF